MSRIRSGPSLLSLFSVRLFPLLRRGMLLLGIFGVIAGLAACQSGDDSEEMTAPPEVEVSAVDYAFGSPDTISAGWTTFKMSNKGDAHHILALVSFPGDRSFGNYKKRLITPYDSLTSLLKTGAIDTTEYREALGREAPEWFPDTENMGGVGLIAPGRTATTTLNLKPGNYLMQCYARTPDGTFHAMRGMLRQLTVTSNSSDADPPQSDVEMTVSKEQIETDSVVAPGEHTIAVQFSQETEDVQYQHLHLARLDPETDATEILQWLDLGPVMPAPVEFLGGVQDMPAGETAYVTVELESGRYAWVLGTPEEGMIKEINVE